MAPRALGFSRKLLVWKRVEKTWFFLLKQLLKKIDFFLLYFQQGLARNLIWTRTCERLYALGFGPGPARPLTWLQVAFCSPLYMYQNKNFLRLLESSQKSGFWTFLWNKKLILIQAELAICHCFSHQEVLQRVSTPDKILSFFFSFPFFAVIFTPGQEIKGTLNWNQSRLISYPV